MNKPKPGKQKKEWHASPSKYGMGDNYGTGIRQPLGRIRDDTVGMVHLSKKQIKTPPKGLA